MDPFSLIAAGVGTAASLGGGIYNAATMSDRKKKWKEEQKRKLLQEAMIRHASEMGMPTGALTARANVNGINDAADEQFKIDPMSFVPFVQQGSHLASGIYDAMQDPTPQDNTNAEYRDPSKLQPAGVNDDGRLAPDDELKRRGQNWYDRWTPYGG